MAEDSAEEWLPFFVRKKCLRRICCADLQRAGNQRRWKKRGENKNRAAPQPTGSKGDAILGAGGCNDAFEDSGKGNNSPTMAPRSFDLADLWLVTGTQCANNLLLRLFSSCQHVLFVLCDGRHWCLSNGIVIGGAKRLYCLL